jgi:hypothetical protein
MKSKLLAVLLLTGSSMFAGTRFFFGVNVGAPYYGGYYAPRVYAPPPPVVSYYAPVRPVYPGPGYAWVDSYYYPVGPRYVYRPGYWARRPYAGAYWVGPRYHGGYYYHGYWRR